MAVAFVNHGGGSGLGTTVNFSYTVGSGSDRLLLLGVYSPVTVSGVTYASVSMTSIATVASVASAWQLVAPTSGSNTVSISLSSYQSTRQAVDDLSGVDQTTPLGTAVTANGSSSTPATGSITVPAGGLAWAFCNHDYTSALTANAGTLAGAHVGGGASWATSYRSDTGALSWTTNGNTAAWYAIGVPVNASGGGGGGGGGGGPLVRGPILSHLLYGRGLR